MSKTLKDLKGFPWSYIKYIFKSVLKYCKEKIFFRRFWNFKFSNKKDFKRY